MNPRCPGHWGFSTPQCLGHKRFLTPRHLEHQGVSWTPGSRESLVFWTLGSRFSSFQKKILTSTHCHSLQSNNQSKNNVNRLVIVHIYFIYVLQKFITSLFILRLPVPRTLGSHFKTWITQQNFFIIPNGFSNCLIGGGGAVRWKNPEQKISCDSLFKWNLAIIWRVLDNLATFVVWSEKWTQYTRIYLYYYLCNIKRYWRRLLHKVSTRTQ